MTVAGSDSGGGAGIQADLKTFTVLGVYGSSAITALTAQNTQGVSGIHPVPPSFLKAQIDAVLSDIGTDAMKIGMLHSAEVVRTVRQAIDEHGVRNVILDPVMVAKSGDRLLEKEAIQALKEELLPVAMLLTPNVPEAGELLGKEAEKEAPEEVAMSIAALGPRAVLLKGGHREGETSDDLLWDSEGEESSILSSERVDTRNSHGTGCTLSSAIAAELAKGQELQEAVRKGKDFISAALRSGKTQQIGHGKGPVDHLHQTKKE